MNVNLSELAVPSMNMGSLTSGECSLVNKDTGSFSTTNTQTGQRQPAYDKPAGQLNTEYVPNKDGIGNLNSNFATDYRFDNGSVSASDRTTNEVLQIMLDSFGVNGFSNQGIIDQI